MAKPKSTGPTALAVGLAVEIAKKKLSPDGECGYCRGQFDPAASNARFTTLFCCLSCERKFIHNGLSSLTVEDCIHIQQRLDEILAAATSMKVAAK